MLVIAAGSAGVAGAGIVEWGLGLSLATVAAVIASTADHQAARSRERAARKLELAIRTANEGRSNVTSFRDWLNEKEQSQRHDVAA